MFNVGSCCTLTSYQANEYVEHQVCIALLPRYTWLSILLGLNNWRLYLGYLFLYFHNRLSSCFMSILQTCNLLCMSVDSLAWCCVFVASVKMKADWHLITDIVFPFLIVTSIASVSAIISAPGTSSAYFCISALSVSFNLFPFVSHILGRRRG